MRVFSEWSKRTACAAVALSLSHSQPCQAAAPSSSPPGIVIDHSPSATGIYIGSPSLVVLPNGSYMASHDEFGPQSTEHTRAVTQVFGSRDRGQTWHKISTVNGQFWSSLFVHRGTLYLLGTDKHHGNAIIRRSLDGGVNWTFPTNSSTGLLRDDGQYHCAPTPVIEHAGRLWRGMERRIPPQGWGITYCAGMLSVAMDADLLNAANWNFSNFLPGNAKWLDGTFGGWLEGNAVVSPTGHLVDVLRVETPGHPEKAAIANLSEDGHTLTFDSETGFIIFPGGAKKFTIRYDSESQRYWSVATIVTERHQSATRPGAARNTLALTSSTDLTNWAERCILAYHPDARKHGFQYVDWQFDGPDIIAACRTAYDDNGGGAHNYHDANFLTFLRLKQFRKLTPTSSVPPLNRPEPNG